MLALALAAVAIFAAASSAHGKHTGERLVVRGTDTVQDGGPCPDGVCDLTLADGAFRGTPVGTGAYTGTLTLGKGTPDRLVLALSGDSCQDGAGPVTSASFTGLARWTVKHGTGAYAKARGYGLATFAEGADDREQTTLIGRITR